MTDSCDVVVRTPETQDEWSRYYGLRWQILRKPWNQPEGSEKDAREHDTWHRAVFCGDRMAGVARMQMNTVDEAQIRYMAVAEEFRGMGFGRMLVQSLEEVAREQGAERVMLDARSDAVGFYVVLGYRVVSDSYLLFDKIQHYLMQKEFY